MQAVLLARVSSTEQQEGHSLAAQLDRLHAYCLRKNLDVIQEFTLVESSTRGERPEFQKMIAYIKKQHQKVALVCDKVDRLQRSFREVPILEQLRKSNKLVLHFVSENQILDAEANNSQIMAYQIFVMMAENYTNCISDNVKRSFEKKIKEGSILTMAPLGYLNVTISGTNTVIMDQDRAPKIRLLFEKYATNTISLNELAEYASEIGLLTKRNTTISPQQIHSIISNPFYYGMMKIKGKLYRHAYKTIIDKDLFDLCERIRTGRHTNINNRKRQDMILAGLVHCPYCGKAYSPYIRKNRYIFLHPPRHETCKHYHLSATPLMEQINNILKTLHFQPAQKTKTLEYLEQQKNEAIIKRDEYISKLCEDRTNLAIKKSRLTDLYLDQGITREEYDKLSEQITNEQHDIQLKIDGLDSRILTFYDNLIKCVKIADISHFLFKSSNFSEKRQILKLVSSNFYIEDKNPVISIRYPFENMLQRGVHKIWGG